MRLNYVPLCFLLILLSACAQQQAQKPVIVMDDIPEPARDYTMDNGAMAEAFSNENVIVYPVEGDVDANRREFPEYRSVLENTTAGGYTVFDPSVTVYAVEGSSMNRPSYLPEYSVPKYAEQYKSTSAYAMTQQVSTSSEPLMPMQITPLRTPQPLYIDEAGRKSRPWVESQTTMDVPVSGPAVPRAPVTDVMVEDIPAPISASIPTQPAPVATQQSGRRSPPMLTGY